MFNGQSKQDEFVQLMLKNKFNGTFVEIGSNHPININNTYVLEKEFKWRGIMCEYDSKFLSLYKIHRPNSTYIIKDATKINWKDEFMKINLPFDIDYLQIDLEVTNNSTLLTLQNLDRDIMDTYKFAVITFEHDIYRGNYFDTQAKSREIFTKHGYKLVAKDVSNENLSFEDWWIHPSLVNDSNMFESMDYKMIIERLKR